jgi:hypothetical protein
MPVMTMLTEGERCWPDLPTLEAQGRLLTAMGPDAPALQVALLRGGMQSGAASVTFRITLPDGRVVLTETSLALFGMAADALRAAAQI